MQKETLHHQNITSNSKELEILKKHFPQCFDKEGSFISHKMEEIVGESGLQLSSESYSLNWLGKSYARLLANEAPHTLIKEDKSHNTKAQNKKSQNLLIKGDNLEVLKHLSNAYSESIKMIYIDPPYNTGSDGFVYNDDRKFTSEELSRLAGVDIEEARRILAFTQSKANSHSAWLTFMYPRLYVARELLKEDGVIFISIDENEQAQLKLLCDEVFGEENFITHFIWKNKKGGGNDSKYVAIEHESIVMYAKNESYLEKLFEEYTPEYLKRYSEEDKESKYFWDTFKRKSGKQYYPIVCPDGSILEFDNNGNKISWLRSQKRFEKDLKKGDIKILKNVKNEWTVHFKQRLPKGKKPRTILIEESLLSESTTSEGSAELLEIFKKNIFNNPKPIKLILKLLNITTEQNDIILDFFAGSGTTAHAVMQLNAQDGGERKFITVQIAEPTDEKSEAHKAGYKTIFEITKARIEKASQKIKEENPDFKGDLGFKIYETTPLWDGYLDDIATLEDETTLFDGSSLSDEELETLLTTYKLHDGIALSEALEEVELDKYKAYLVKETLYCVHSGFSTQALKTLIEKLDSDAIFEPSRIILFGYNFSTKHQRELDEALSSYANKKSIELDLIVRY
jgi:adenine-specific DNA-methyltransferase